MRRVRDFMDQDVRTVGPEASVAELIRLLDGAEPPGVPVVDPEKGLVGVVSARDVLRLARTLQGAPDGMRWGLGVAGALDEPTGRETLTAAGLFAYYVTRSGKFVDVRDRIRELPGDLLGRCPVKDIMRAPPAPVGADATAPQLARLLRDRRVQRVLVVEAGEVVGTVSTMDLLGELSDRPEPAPAALPWSEGPAPAKGRGPGAGAAGRRDRIDLPSHPP